MTFNHSFSSSLIVSTFSLKMNNISFLQMSNFSYPDIQNSSPVNMNFSSLGPGHTSILVSPFIPLHKMLDICILKSIIDLFKCISNTGSFCCIYAACVSLYFDEK